MQRKENNVFFLSELWKINRNTAKSFPTENRWIPLQYLTFLKKRFFFFFFCLFILKRSYYCLQRDAKEGAILNVLQMNKHWQNYSRAYLDVLGYLIWHCRIERERGFTECCWNSDAHKSSLHRQDSSLWARDQTWGSDAKCGTNDLKENSSGLSWAFCFFLPSCG